MTQHPDDRTPDDAGGPDHAHRLEEDAAWAEIVANYGERAELDPEPPAPVVEEERSDASRPPGESDWSPFDRTYLDAEQERASAAHHELGARDRFDAEEHFVPPTPPPLPRLDPRRKAAWLALFGSPVLMLLGVVLGWTYPGWVSFLLVVAFVGGFGYLVATMPRGGDRGWPGDDGAVV